MWRKSICSPSFLPIPILLILQISYGRPAEKDAYFNSTTHPSPITEVAEIDLEKLDLNSSSSSSSTHTEILSVSLTVLFENDTLAESSSTALFTAANLSSSINSTKEPEYYDEADNSTASSALEGDEVSSSDYVDSELEAMSLHLDNSSTEESPSSSSSITGDELEVAAASLDESVTASASAPQLMEESRQQLTISRSVQSPSSTSATFVTDRDTDSITQAEDGDGDDSIIIASMSSNLNVDTVEPPHSSPSHSDSTRMMETEMGIADEMQTEVIISSSSEPSPPLPVVAAAAAAAVASSTPSSSDVGDVDV